jgi:hypothetical protein
MVTGLKRDPQSSWAQEPKGVTPIKNRLFLFILAHCMAVIALGGGGMLLRLWGMPRHDNHDIGYFCEART